MKTTVDELAAKIEREPNSARYAAMADHAEELQDENAALRAILATSRRHISNAEGNAALRADDGDEVPAIAAEWRRIATELAAHRAEIDAALAK